MENKILIFSEYSYIENTINIELAENVQIIQEVRIVKDKLLNLLKKADIDPELFQILSHYLNLNNERPTEIPTEQNIRYLHTLSNRLIKALKTESSFPKEHVLLRLFIYLNFNKDQIIDYYINKIDFQLEENTDNQEDILECYLNESEYLPKKDVIYTSENHQLGKIIHNHVSILRRQLHRQNEQLIPNSAGSYRYIPRIFDLTGTADMMMYGLNMLINTGILKVHVSFKTMFEFLSQLVRGANGKPFSPSTLRSRFNTYSLKTLYKMADLLKKLTEYNEHQIKIQTKSKGK